MTRKSKIERIYCIAKAMQKKATRKETQFNLKHMKMLRTGDIVCNEYGTPIGIFDGRQIQSSGHTAMSNVRISYDNDFKST
jgi:hypothetical protein